jgi:hypothetical protein
VGSRSIRVSREGAAPVPDYKLYFMDDRDRISRRVDLECRDDDHAIEIVSEHPSSDGMELWQESRLVKRFEPRQV